MLKLKTLDAFYKIQDAVAHKKLYGVLFADSKEIELFNNCISSIKSNGIGEEESNELITIYKGLNSIFDNISSDWDGNKGSLNAQKIIVHYQNLESILKIVNIIKELKTRLGQAFVIFDFDESGLIQDIESLQKKMKEELEKIQQQKSQKELFELEKKSKEEFGKYIENGTIDEISIKKYSNQDRLYTIIKLKEDNKSTDIKVSEFLNSDFCKKNKIVSFFISNGNQKEFIVPNLGEKPWT